MAASGKLVIDRVSFSSYLPLPRLYRYGVHDDCEIAPVKKKKTLVTNKRGPGINGMQCWENKGKSAVAKLGRHVEILGRDGNHFVSDIHYDIGRVTILPWN